MIIILKILFSLFLGLASGLAGSRWIDILYKNQPAVLSFPQNRTARSRFRRYGLTALLILLYYWIIMIIGETSKVASISLLVFDYFLILFTFTDFEQQVIFDRMLIPFAILGLLQTFILQQPLINHLLAAIGGGLLFLLLAVLTRGGIGGGDIKLIAALGFWLGTDTLLTVATIGLILGGLAAFFLMITKQKKRNDFFAYGPYFTITAILLTNL